MEPITLGIAFLTALILGGCGGSGGKLFENNNDAGPNEMDGGVGTTGTGASRGIETGGSGGVAGNDATGGSGGSGGVGGTAGGDNDAGMEASSYVDATTPDAGNPIELPYHFGMIYGSNPVTGLRGTGTLLFSGVDPCQLLGGSFETESQTGEKSGISIDLANNQSLDFCASEVTLPLAGGLFDGVSWLLTNQSDPLSSTSWEISACSSGLQSDAGAPIENCSGALEITNP